MKKLIYLIFCVAITMVTFAQERTVDLNSGIPFDLAKSKTLAYNGNTSDRLIPTTRDTIDYFVLLSGQESGPLHFYANITFDTIAGIDTTVEVTVQNKTFNTESYSDLIASATTSVISAEVIVNKTTLGVTSEFIETQTFAAFNAMQDTSGSSTELSDTLRFPSYTASITGVVSSTLYYRFLKFRLIISGDDSVGTGIKMKRIEIVFYN